MFTNNFYAMLNAYNYGYTKSRSEHGVLGSDFAFNGENTDVKTSCTYDFDGATGIFTPTRTGELNSYFVSKENISGTATIGTSQITSRSVTLPSYSESQSSDNYTWEGWNSGGERITIARAGYHSTSPANTWGLSSPPIALAATDTQLASTYDANWKFEAKTTKNWPLGESSHLDESSLNTEHWTRLIFSEGETDYQLNKTNTRIGGRIFGRLQIQTSQPVFTINGNSWKVRIPVTILNTYDETVSIKEVGSLLPTCRFERTSGSSDNRRYYNTYVNNYILLNRIILPNAKTIASGNSINLNVEFELAP